MISVIIPIYKVEKYIRRCAISLFKQTLWNVEYLFVDDATPDNSIEVLESCIAMFPERKNQIKILKHSCNLGLPAARNTGLKVAQGEYIYHCDSDDFLEPNALTEMYKKAKEQDADYVWCDWFLSFERNERYMKQPVYSSALDALKGMLSGTMKFNVWNKLVKRSLYEQNNIRFPEGHGMGEDMTMIRLLVCAERVGYVSQAYYHYVKLNTGAFTTAYSLKSLEDLRYNVDETVRFVNGKTKGQLKEEIAYFLLNVKLPFLISDNKRMYRLWVEWYPDVNDYILANKQLSIRLRLLQYAAAKGWFRLVWLYYVLVYKFVYGVIYK